MKFALNALLMLILGWTGELTAEEPLSPEVRNTVGYILNCYGADQESLQHLVPVAKIMQMDCKIEKLGMFFDYYGSIDIPGARRLVLNAANQLLQTVNSSDKLKAHLQGGSLTIDDTLIRIRIRPKRCGFYYPPLGSIAFVSSMEGKIIYDTLNSYSYELNNLMTEPYLTALKLNAIY